MPLTHPLLSGSPQVLHCLIPVLQTRIQAILSYLPALSGGKPLTQETQRMHKINLAHNDKLWEGRVFVDPRSSLLLWPAAMATLKKIKAGIVQISSITKQN